MGDEKSDYFPIPIFEMTDGTKYALNPFAEQPDKDLETEIHEQLSMFCSHCNLSFADGESFLKHNTEFHTKKVYSCNICDARFRRIDHLKRHIISVHNLPKCTVCPVCDLDCKRQVALMKHIQKKHSDTKEVFRCQDCTFEGSTLPELEKHVSEIHCAADRHSCPHCHTTFKRRDHMLRHVKSQHMNQIEQCPICPQQYRRRDHVVRHMREKHRMGIVNGEFVSIEVVKVDTLS